MHEQLEIIIKLIWNRCGNDEIIIVRGYNR